MWSSTRWCAALVVLLAAHAAATPSTTAINTVSGVTTVPMHAPWDLTLGGPTFVTDDLSADYAVALVETACPSSFQNMGNIASVASTYSGWFDFKPLLRGSEAEPVMLSLGADVWSYGFNIIDAGSQSGAQFTGHAMEYGRFFNADGNKLEDIFACSGTSCTIVLQASFNNWGDTHAVTLSESIAHQLEIAELNGDGLEDAIVITASGIELVLSDGVGNIGSYSTSAIGACASARVSTLDVDADGDLDVIATCGSGTLTFFANDGTGSFAAGVVLHDPGNARVVRDLVVVDVTNDDLADVVVVTFDAPNSLAVYQNTGSANENSWSYAVHATWTGTPGYMSVSSVVGEGNKPGIVMTCDDCDAQNGVFYFRWDFYEEAISNTPRVVSATVGKMLVSVPASVAVPDAYVVMMSASAVGLYGTLNSPRAFGVATSETVIMSYVTRDAPSAQTDNTYRLCYRDQPNDDNWAMQSEAATQVIKVSSIENNLARWRAASIVDGSWDTNVDTSAYTMAQVSRDGDVVVWVSSTRPATYDPGSGTHVLKMVGEGATTVVDVSGETSICTGASRAASVSPNGRYIAYASSCQDIQGATAATSDQRVYLFDTTLGSTARLHADSAGCTTIYTTMVADNGVVVFVGEACGDASHDCVGGGPGGAHAYVWTGSEMEHLACTASGASVSGPFLETVAVSSSGNKVAVAMVDFRPISLASFTTTPSIASPLVFVYTVSTGAWEVGSAVSADTIVASRVPRFTAYGEHLSYVALEDATSDVGESDGVNSVYLRTMSSYATEYCGAFEGAGEHSTQNQMGFVSEDGTSCVVWQLFDLGRMAAMRYNGITSGAEVHVFRRTTQHFADTYLGGEVRIDWLSVKDGSEYTRLTSGVYVVGAYGDGRGVMVYGDDWASLVDVGEDTGTHFDEQLVRFELGWSRSLVDGAYTPTQTNEGTAPTLDSLPTANWKTDSGVHVGWAAEDSIVGGMYCRHLWARTEFFQSGDSIGLGGTFDETGTFALCASSDGGVSYYYQPLASEMDVNKAPTADDLTATTPATWETQELPMLTLTVTENVVVTETTQLAFSAAAGQCDTLVGTTTVSSNPVELGVAIATAGAYSACLSFDGGTSWTAQNAGAVLVTAAATPVGGASGDPHFLGMHGGYYDFAGEPGRVFNLLSDTYMQVNALFVRNEDGLPGNYMAEIGVALGNRTRIAFRRDGRVSIHPLHRVAGVDNRAHIEGGGMVEWTPTELVVAWDVYRLQLNKYGWREDMARSEAAHLGYRLWVDEHKLRAQGRLESFAPHGVHGVSWRAWSVAVPTGVQGEGVLEGEWEDYALASGDLFGTDFAYNQYAATPCPDDVGVPSGEHMSAGPIRAV